MVLVTLCSTTAPIFARPHPHPTPLHITKPHSHWHPIGPVYITGYDDTGFTFTGDPTGPGGCADYPGWYPLGTTFRVHLGPHSAVVCTANDTGSLVGPRHLDLWVPTAAAADTITGMHPTDVWR